MWLAVRGIAAADRRSCNGDPHWRQPASSKSKVCRSYFLRPYICPLIYPCTDLSTLRFPTLLPFLHSFVYFPHDLSLRRSVLPCARKLSSSLSSSFSNERNGRAILTSFHCQASLVCGPSLFPFTPLFLFVSLLCHHLRVHCSRLLRPAVGLRAYLHRNL